MTLDLCDVDGSRLRVTSSVRRGRHGSTARERSADSCETPEGVGGLDVEAFGEKRLSEIIRKTSMPRRSDYISRRSVLVVDPLKSVEDALHQRSVDHRRTP